MEPSCWISLPVKDCGVKKIQHSRIVGHFTLVLHQKNPACFPPVELILCECNAASGPTAATTEGKVSALIH